MGGRRRYGAVGGGMGFVVAGALAVGGAYRLLPPLTAPARLDVHAEYIKYASGRDSIAAYVAYPERADPAPAVLVIHEIFGMSDFVRSATERLAQDGFIALAPDLLTRRGGTPASPDSARRLIASLSPDTITQDLNAGFAFLRGMKVVRADAIGVIGVCWGGGASFRYATTNPSLGAFVVCYGPGPNRADIGRIRARGFGVYADRDGRINQKLFNLDMALHEAHVKYTFKVFPNVGHGFLRTRENPKVADDAWGAIIAFFLANLGK